MNMFNEIDNDTTTMQYDDTKTVINGMMLLFIKQKKKDKVFGFNKIKQLSIALTTHNNRYNEQEIHVKRCELRMLYLIMMDELALLCKMRYGIHALQCSEDELFNQCKTELKAHINLMVNP